jgi:hypothetical protein
MVGQTTEARSKTIVIFAHLIQSASNFPTSVSTLESSISALESDIKTLESSSVPWEHSVWVFTFLVAVGVAMELWVIRHEYRDDMEAWALAHFGLLRSPGRPSIKKFSVEVGSVLLITIGIMGELGVGIKIASINGALRGKSAELRSKSDQLLAFVRLQAGDARDSAKTAHDEADVVGREADAIQKRLDGASRQLGEAERQVRIQGPRRRLLEDNRDKFLEAIKPFAGQRVTVVKCGYALQAEPEQLEQYLLNLLGVSKASKPNAGWAVESPGYTMWAKCNTGASAVGGNLVIVSSTADRTVKAAATALNDALNRIDISTIQTESTPESRQLERQFLGDDSPWELAIKDPTAVIILIGTNPMFDLSGWHKRHK